MAVIKPTITLSSNADTYTPASGAGPLSFALSLNATDTLTVDAVDQRTIITSDTLNANTGGPNGPIDGSAIAADAGADADGNDNLTAGTIGGFIYLKNNSTVNGENIYIALVTGSGATDPQAPAAPAASGTTALDNDTHDTLRTFTLLPGEFAWFPWDYAGDLHWEAAAGTTPQLEYWRFNR